MDPKASDCLADEPTGSKKVKTQKGQLAIRFIEIVWACLCQASEVLFKCFFGLFWVMSSMRGALEMLMLMLPMIWMGM